MEVFLTNQKFFMKTPSVWHQDEIKNLLDLYTKYHVPIEEIASILNRTNRDTMKKLIELKKIEDPNTILTTIMTLHKEISRTNKINPLELLCQVVTNLEKRIKNIERK